MTIAGFLVEDKLRQIRFFEETFLFANTNIEIVLKMSFLSRNNADVKFEELGTFTSRSYITAEIYQPW